MRAAGIIFNDPATGRVLLLRRVPDGTWDYPGGRLKPGETVEEAAIREAWEECGFRCGHSGHFHCRRVRGGTDYTTFRYDTEEFIPRLSREHDAYLWARPADVLPKDAKRR